MGKDRVAYYQQEEALREVWRDILYSARLQIKLMRRRAYAVNGILMMSSWCTCHRFAAPIDHCQVETGRCLYAHTATNLLQEA